MIGFIFILLVSLLLYFILTESITIRLTIKEAPQILISFIFLSVSFYFTHGQGDLSLRKKIDSSLFALRLFNEIIPRSYVTVISYDYDDFLFNDLRLPRLFLTIFAPAILAYINSKSAYTEYSEDIARDGIDITLDITLYSLFISLVKASYYQLKRKLARN